MDFVEVEDIMDYIKIIKFEFGGLSIILYFWD